MADHLGMAAQAAGNALRFGWYTGVSWLATRAARRHAEPIRYTPARPVPDRAELMADLRALLIRDAEGVRDGVYPANEDEVGGLAEHLARLRAMFADIPATAGRRTGREAQTAAVRREAAGLPAYFAQDFHYQTGGYLSDESARIYDVQVETLFNGAAAAMRRAGLRPIAEFVRGRDQRSLRFLDVACGTGRFLRQVRLAFPALPMTGLDLSRAYLEEAATHLAGLRPVDLVFGNAEAMPFAAASQDIVTAIFLFHELPPEVRQRVTEDISRILKPGGLFVWIDSLQYGDKPEWDGLLEGFPVRFHEPYFASYASEDLSRLFSKAGLVPHSHSRAFLSKVEVWRRAGA